MKQENEATDLINDYSKVFFRCVESSSDAIMLTCTQGVIRYVNKAWERLYGFNREEAIGQTPRLLRSGHHKPTFYAQMWAQILDPSKGYWKGEITNRSRSGKDVVVLLTISPFRNDHQETQGYLSIAVDVTEKKHREMQMARQDRLASIGLLASGLAHEIGTPLGVIRGRAEYLLTDAPVNQRPSLETIVSQIDRISKLIYSLLNLANTRLSETTTIVEVDKVLDEVLQLLDQKLRAHHIRFEIELNENVKVMAEKDQLTQVLLNLILNSIQAIESAAASGREDSHYIQMSAKRDGVSWEIAVKDTGCGISKDNMKNLFRPFFTTKDVGVGTGLGLVVTHQILQSWGGSISVESEEGKGATFRIRLPQG